MSVLFIVLLAKRYVWKTEEKEATNAVLGIGLPQVMSRDFDRAAGT